MVLDGPDWIFRDLGCFSGLDQKRDIEPNGHQDFLDLINYRIKRNSSNQVQGLKIANLLAFNRYWKKGRSQLILDFAFLVFPDLEIII